MPRKPRWTLITEDCEDVFHGGQTREVEALAEVETRSLQEEGAEGHGGPRGRARLTNEEVDEMIRESAGGAGGPGSRAGAGERGGRIGGRDKGHESDEEGDKGDARARAKGKDQEEGTAIEPSGRLRKKKVPEGQRRR